MSNKFVIWSPAGDSSAMKQILKLVKDNQGDKVKLLRASGNEENPKRLLVESESDFLSELLSEHSSEIEIEPDSDISLL